MDNDELDIIIDIYGAISNLRCANIRLEDNKTEIKEETIQTYKNLLLEINKETEKLNKYIVCAHNHLR